MFLGVAERASEERQEQVFLLRNRFLELLLGALRDRWSPKRLAGVAVHGASHIQILMNRLDNLLQLFLEAVEGLRLFHAPSQGPGGQLCDLFLRSAPRAPVRFLLNRVKRRCSLRKPVDGHNYPGDAVNVISKLCSVRRSVSFFDPGVVLWAPRHTRGVDQHPTPRDLGGEESIFGMQYYK